MPSERRLGISTAGRFVITGSSSPSLLATIE